MNSKIIEIIRKYVSSDSEITLESKIENDLYIDSLKMLEIICDLENSLNVKICFSDLKNVVFVKDFLECIQSGGEKNGDEIL